jgi:hypothetical protein
MKRGILTDKLLDMCEHYAEKIAEQWYQAVSTNPRTPSYRSIPKETCLFQAAFLYTSSATPRPVAVHRRPIC